MQDMKLVELVNRAREQAHRDTQALRARRDAVQKVAAVGPRQPADLRPHHVDRGVGDRLLRCRIDHPSRDASRRSLRVEVGA